jgi:beta-aspartyl-peptidase (threonine type)
MNPKLAASIIAGLAVVATGGLLSHRTSVADEVGSQSLREKEIRAVLNAQDEAWNRGDLEGFMEGYWIDERLLFCSGDTVTRGWKAALERYRKRYKAEGKEMGKLTFSDLEFLDQTDRLAVVRGRFHLTLSKGASEGLFTLLFRPIDGKWRIVYDHTSAKP